MVDRQRLEFADAEEWERWLEQHHASPEFAPGVSIALAKKGSGIPSPTQAETLDVALCFGWIDGIRNSLDDKQFLQSYMPRRARSTWSQVNRDKVAALIEAGRMRPAGQAEIDRAKADGRWDAAYASVATIEVPDDLATALAASPAAAGFFTTLSSQNRYAILFRIHQAKRPETRTRRIADFVAMLERGETVYPQKKPAQKKAGS